MTETKEKFSRFYYLPALALIAFHLFVMSVVFRPDVSEAYRLYYFDKKLKHWPGDSRLEYRLGDLIDFSDRVIFLSREGWSNPEKWGTWTIGNEASLLFRLDKPPKKDVEFLVEMIAFVRPALPLQTVSVSANEKPVDDWVYNWGDKRSVFRAVIPLEVIEPDGFNRIDFLIPNAKSPSALGESKDRRVLGIGVSEMIIREYRD